MYENESIMPYPGRVLLMLAQDRHTWFLPMGFIDVFPDGPEKGENRARLFACREKLCEVSVDGGHMEAVANALMDRDPVITTALKAFMSTM